MATKPTNPGTGPQDAARTWLTAASMAVMSGNLGYEAEQWMESGQEVIEDLLRLIAVRDERDAALEAAARKPFGDLARTVAEIEAERERRRAEEEGYPRLRPVD